MRQDFTIKHSRKASRAIHVLRAMFSVKPKKARKAGKKAAREFDRLNPKPGTKPKTVKTTPPPRV